MNKEKNNSCIKDTEKFKDILEFNYYEKIQLLCNQNSDTEEKIKLLDKIDTYILEEYIKDDLSYVYYLEIMKSEILKEYIKNSFI